MDPWQRLQAYLGPQPWPNRLPFTEEAIRAYLDDCIEYWRHYGVEARDAWNREMAATIVDTLQSVRTSILGETLPLEASMK